MATNGVIQVIDKVLLQQKIFFISTNTEMQNKGLQKEKNGEIGHIMLNFGAFNNYIEFYQA